MGRDELPFGRRGELPELSYFGMQASWGVTKHMGGPGATQELAELCQVAADTLVLEVGSGAGETAVRLAETYECCLVGIDVAPGMLRWARARALRRDIANPPTFVVADAQALPFQDGCFDAVVCESVTAFVPDKSLAVSEYARVVREDGRVGLNEGTWLQPPSEEVSSYATRAMGGATFLPAQGWRALLERAGLADIVVATRGISAVRQRMDEIRGIGLADLGERLRALRHFMSLCLHSPAFRQYAKGLLPSRRVMRDLFRQLGLGLYVGHRA